MRDIRSAADTPLFGRGPNTWPPHRWNCCWRTARRNSCHFRWPVRGTGSPCTPRRMEPRERRPAGRSCPCRSACICRGGETDAGQDPPRLGSYERGGLKVALLLLTSKRWYAKSVQLFQKNSIYTWVLENLDDCWWSHFSKILILFCKNLFGKEHSFEKLMSSGYIFLSYYNIILSYY